MIVFAGNDARWKYELEALLPPAPGEPKPMLLGPGSLKGESEENFLRLQMGIVERTVGAPPWLSRRHCLEAALRERVTLCLATSMVGLDTAKVRAARYTQRYAHTNWKRARRLTDLSWDGMLKFANWSSKCNLHCSTSTSWFLQASAASRDLATLFYQEIVSHNSRIHLQVTGHCRHLEHSFGVLDFIYVGRDNVYKL